MSRVCQLSGKGPRTGHNVSHSHRKTKRRFIPNLLTKKIYNPITGKMIKLKVAASTLRTLTKEMKNYLSGTKEQKQK